MTIDLSGVEGSPHHPQKADSAANVIGTNSDGSGKSGKKGSDGLPGLPGDPGGNFFGAGKEFIGIEKLTINVSGGRGGKGQDGGNGSNGSDATKNGSKELLLQRTAETLTEMQSVGTGDKPKFLETHKSYGREGGVGGDAGKAGTGGIGGLPGKVQFVDIDPHKCVQAQGNAGEKGITGIPGKGGYSGEIYTRLYVNTKFSGEYTKGIFIDIFDYCKTGVVGFPKVGVNEIQKAIQSKSPLSLAGAASAMVVVCPITVIGSIGILTIMTTLATVIGAPIMLGIDLYDIYTNSGWQEKVKKDKRPSEDGEALAELNSKSRQKPETSYEKFKEWMMDHHLLATYHEYLKLLEIDHDYLTDKIEAHLAKFTKKTVTQRFYEEDLLTDMSSVHYEETSEHEIAEEVIRMPSNPKWNAFNQRDNPNYFYQINDIKIIQSCIQEKLKNKVLILDPCSKDQSVDNVIRLSISGKYDIPILCLLNCLDSNSLSQWVVMVIVSNHKDKIAILYDNDIVEEVLNTHKSIHEKLKTDYISVHFNHGNSNSKLQRPEDSAIIALENMYVMARGLSTNCYKFIKHFAEYSGLFVLDQVPYLRKEVFARQYVSRVYTSILIQKKQEQNLAKQKEKHQPELNDIAQTLEKLSVGGIRIKILKHYDILNRDNQKLFISEGESHINQAILICTAIQKVKSGKIYSYCYKIFWTKDLDEERNIKFAQVKQLFKDKEFRLEEDASKKIITIIPKANEAPYPFIPMPEVSSSELYRALNIEKDVWLQREVDTIASECLYSLAKKWLSPFESDKENSLIEVLIKGNVKIQDTYLLLRKKVNEPVIEWINTLAKKNTDFENKVLEVIESIVKGKEMEMVDQTQTYYEINKLFLVNLVCQDIACCNLPSQWLSDFTDLSTLIGQD